MASLPRAKVSSSVAGMASEEQDPSESSLSSYRCGLDIFFGLNNETRDFDRGLLTIRQAASAAVPVPDAVWFANQVFGTELTEEALVELFKRLSNDARALCFQALLYGTFAVKQRYEMLRFELWYESSNRGFPLAHGWAGYCRHKGVGTVKNEGDAIRLWRRGSELGDALSQYFFGMHLLEKQHADEAVELLKQSANQGLFQSTKLLIECYDREHHRHKNDPLEAAYWSGRYVASGGILPLFGKQLDNVIEGRTIETELRPHYLFAIGKALVLYRTDRYRFEQMATKAEIESVNYVRNLFKRCLTNADQCILLVLCSARFQYHVPKNVVIMLGKRMWADRGSFDWYRPEFLEPKEGSHDGKCVLQ